MRKLYRVYVGCVILEVALLIYLMSRLVDGGSPMAFVLSMIAIAVVMACIGHLLSKIEELNNKNGKE